MKSILIPVIFALCTALCWGLYGPTVAKARSPIGEWSPFKPYVFIGIAYLVWAVAGGLAAMNVKGDSYTYTGSQSPAMTWGFWAGTLGAFGALGLTSAMITGGKPAYVMPIVFGGAVTVNAIVAYIQLAGRAHTSPMLWMGMLLVAAGVVLVARNTPHGAPPKKPATETSQVESAVAPPAEAAASAPESRPS